MKQVQVALAMMAGAVFLFCAQNMASPNGGVIPDAGAQQGGGTCCTPAAPQRETLRDEETPNNCRMSSTVHAAIDIGAYQQAVAHVNNCNRVKVRYKNGVAGFVQSSEVICSTSTALISLSPSLGKEVELEVTPTECIRASGVTVVGQRG